MSVRFVSSAAFPTRFGEFRIHAFSEKGRTHLALVKGEVRGGKNIPVRIHSKCLTGDVFGSLRCDCRSQLEKSLQLLGQGRRGILLYLDQEGRGIGLGNKIRAYRLQDGGLDTVEANRALGFAEDERNYAAASEILKFFKVRSVRLLTNNPEKMSGLSFGGITVSGRIPLIIEPNEHNAAYLAAKEEKLGHLLGNGRKFMSLALELARKANPSPNPKVGAVVVKGGRIIATGFHKKAGKPHAEIEALEKLKPGDAQGATLYVTLEPCSHYGRTPPCTKAIIKAGIRKVVAAMRDPNPVVGGIEELQRNGIGVEVGLMGEEARKLNGPFVKFMETGIPFVTLKSAMSLDGKIACANGDSKWITSPAARLEARKLRAEHDAVLVGINTVLKDDPRLTARIRGRKNPLRIILDSKLRIPLNAKVFADSNAIVATSERHGKSKKRELERRGIRVLVAGVEKVDLRKLVRMLAALGITSVLIEGGGEVNASALNAGIVDRLIFFIAPKLIGGRNAPGPVGGEGADAMADVLGLRDFSVRKIGKDFLIEARPAM